MSIVHFFKKHCGKRRNCSLWAISPFPTVFSTRSGNFLPKCDCRLQTLSVWKSLKLLFWKGLIYSWYLSVNIFYFTTQSWLLTTFRYKHFENVVGKSANAGNQHFLLFPQCFLPVLKQIWIFQPHLFVVCKCFQFSPFPTMFSKAVCFWCIKMSVYGIKG